MTETTPMVTIPKSEYEYLLESRRWLTTLNDHGMKFWDNDRFRDARNEYVEEKYGDG